MKYFYFFLEEEVRLFACIYKKFPYIKMLLKYLGQRYNVNKKSMKNPIKPNDNVSGQAVIHLSNLKI